MALGATPGHWGLKTTNHHNHQPKEKVSTLRVRAPHWSMIFRRDQNHGNLWPWRNSKWICTNEMAKHNSRVSNLGSRSRGRLVVSSAKLHEHRCFSHWFLIASCDWPPWCHRTKCLLWQMLHGFLVVILFWWRIYPRPGREDPWGGWMNSNCLPQDHNDRHETAAAGWGMRPPPRWAFRRTVRGGGRMQARRSPAWPARLKLLDHRREHLRLSKLFRKPLAIPDLFLLRRWSVVRLGLGLGTDSGKFRKNLSLSHCKLN